MPALQYSGTQRTDRTLRLPLPRLAESSVLVDGHELVLFTDDALREACSTKIAFTSRLGGTSTGDFEGLDLSEFVGDNPACVLRNRDLLAQAMDADADSALISPKQVHGTDVLVVEDLEQTQQRAMLGADGIVCSKEDVLVLLCFADCLPLILVSPQGDFAVLHAGWRGALAGIPKIGLQTLSKETACEPEEINCYIGPHIKSCCFEVGDEVLSGFVETYGKGVDAADRHLDLDVAVRASLLSAGASSERMCSVNICTSCNTDRFFSYRAEDGTTGRHGACAIRKGAR